MSPHADPLRGLSDGRGGVEAVGFADGGGATRDLRGDLRSAPRRPPGRRGERPPRAPPRPGAPGRQQRALAEGREPGDQPGGRPPGHGGRCGRRCRGPGGQLDRARCRRAVLHGGHLGHPPRRGPEPGPLRHPRQRRGCGAADLGAGRGRPGRRPRSWWSSGPGSPPVPPLPGWRWERVEVPSLEVSSTELRTRAEAGRPLDFLVTHEVLECIAERGLYGQRRQRSQH